MGVPTPTPLISVSRGGILLPSICADACCIDAVQLPLLRIPRRRRVQLQQPLRPPRSTTSTSTLELRMKTACGVILVILVLLAATTTSSVLLDWLAPKRCLSQIQKPRPQRQHESCQQARLKKPVKTKGCGTRLHHHYGRRRRRPYFRRLALK